MQFEGIADSRCRGGFETRPWSDFPRSGMFETYPYTASCYDFGRLGTVSYSLSPENDGQSRVLRGTSPPNPLFFRELLLSGNQSSVADACGGLRI